jgi:hypothetical protein
VKLNPVALAGSICAIHSSAGGRRGALVGDDYMEGARFPCADDGSSGAVAFFTAKSGNGKKRERGGAAEKMCDFYGVMIY